MGSDSGLFFVGASVTEAPVEGGEWGWGCSREIVEDLNSSFAEGGGQFLG